MRLYHQLYRKKNPPQKRRALSGVRKSLYDDLMALMRMRNPEGSIRGRTGARIQREALMPGIVAPVMTRTEAQKWKSALSRLEKWEKEEREKEREREAEYKERAKVEKWKEKKEREELRRLGKTEPLRRSMLKRAAKREIEAREAWRKASEMPPLTKGERAELLEDIQKGVAAKWNLLGELSRRIAAGRRALIPLRNTVAAEIEGRLSGPQLQYTLSEALAELSVVEIKAVRKMLAEAPRRIGRPIVGEEFVAHEIEPARERAAREPQVLRARRKVERAQAYERESIEIARKARERERATTPWAKSQILLERERLARKEAEAYAKLDPRAIAVERRDVPKDDELWNKIAVKLAARAISGDDQKRGAKIVKSFKKYEKTLKRYRDVKKLEIVPYIPPSFARITTRQARIQETLEEDRLRSLKDDEAARGQLRVFREQVKIKTGNYPRIKTVDQYREYLIRRLYDMVSSRWRSVLMTMYENKGGRYLTASELHIYERAIKKELGAAFPMGHGLNGIVIKTNGKYKWKVFDDEGTALMWGRSESHRAASRKIRNAYGVTVRIFHEAEKGEPGFDFLKLEDRKWLSANKPNMATMMKRILMASLDEKRDVDAATIRWLATKEALEEPMAIKREEYTAAKDCKGMKAGEKRVVRGKGFTIFAERTKRGDRYKMFVVTKDGHKSAVYRLKGCKEIMARGSLVAGAMVAGRKVVAAVGNPASLSRLENSARRYFRKKNPIGGGVKLPRRPAEVGSIEDLSAMIRLPDDADEAYRLGYYAGIIKGIDTCGVQNYLKRRKLRKEFTQRLLDAVISHQEMLTEPRGRGRRGREVLETDWLS